MPRTKAEQELLDELLNDPEVMAVLNPKSTPIGATTKGKENIIRNAQYDSPVAKALAPVEQTLAPIAAGFSRVGTFGLSGLAPGFNEAHQALQARAPAGVGAGGLAASIPQVLAQPESAVGRVALNTAAPAAIEYGATGDPAAAAKMGLAGFGLSALSEMPVMSQALKSGAESEAARSLGLGKSSIKKLGASSAPMQEAERKALGRTLLNEGLVSPFKSTEELATRAGGLHAEAGQKIGGVMQTLQDLGETTGMTVPELIRAIEKDPHLAQMLNEIGSKEGPKVNELSSELMRRGRQSPGYQPGSTETTMGPSGIEPVTSETPEKFPPVTFPELQSYKQEVGQNLAYPRVTEASGGILPGTQGYQGAQSGYHTIKDVQEKAVEQAALRHPGEVNYPEYLQNKERYGNLEEINRHFADLNAAEKSRNVVPLRSAIGGASAAAQGAPEAALATAGLTIAQRTAHPAAALIMDKMGELMASPKFSPMFRDALQRGPKALASLDFVLQQTDPDYLKVLGVSEAK